VEQAFEKLGVEYRPAERSKSDLYLDFLPLVNAGRAEVLDVPRLATQLLGLERRTSRGGRDSIDHAPGGHDDVANAAPGALVMAERGVPLGEWHFRVRPPTGIAARIRDDPALGGLAFEESARDGPLRAGARDATERRMPVPPQAIRSASSPVDMRRPPTARSRGMATRP
jgi:hypothetical protein